MFCMKCGTKLPDDAKFCYKCGAKVPEGLSGGAETPPEPTVGKETSAAADTPAKNGAPKPITEEAAVPDEGPSEVSGESEANLPDIPGEHALISSKYHIDFPRPLALRRELWAPFNREGYRQQWFVAQHIRKNINVEDYQDPNELLKALAVIIFGGCRSSIEEAVEVLIDHGVDFVSSNDLMDKLFDHFNQTDLARGLAQDAEAIDKYLQQLGVEKEMNKANWQGGGFGITGAIKGAVEASMLNMAQDGLSSLGRAITGNTYEGRAKKFIRQRLDHRDYATMGGNIANNIISVWLVNEIVDVLVQNHKLPPFSFHTREVKSRMDNINAMLEKGRYTKDMAMQALCDCLASTGSSFSVYLAMAKLEPEAIPDILKVADSEGDALALADILWDKMHQSGSIAFPKWVESMGIEEGYNITSAAEMSVVRYLFEQFPEQYRDRVFFINGDNLTVPFYPDLEEANYYGFGDNVKFAYDGTEPLDFSAHAISFFNIHFEPPYAAVEAARVEKLREEARLAQEQGNFEEAEDAYLAGANMGDPECMYRLGLLLQGDDESEDADTWLQTAADLGHPEASWEYFQQSVREDETPDYDYLFKAAKAGHGMANFKAGEIYENGTDLEDGKDFDKAVTYYKRAAELGVEGAAEAMQRAKKALYTPEFQEALFKNYRKYQGSDEEKALDYLRRSAALGYEEARSELSAWDLKKAAEARQDGSETDWESVCALYEEAAKYNSPQGCYEFALLKEKGLGKPIDQEGAAALILQSAQYGYGPACVRMGQKEAGSGHAEEAFQWYQKGAAADDLEAYIQLGFCYQTGSGCDLNLKKALTCFRKAYAGGVNEAEASMVRADLEWGDECQAVSRFSEALACYEEAASCKNVDGMLKAAKLRGNAELQDCYDYIRAMSWYDNAAVLRPETKETKEARICLKASGSFEESMAYFARRYGSSLQGSHYHLGQEITEGILNNAMDAYGSRMGVERSDVFIVCDASNALLWGKAKDGFILTKSGYVYNSQGMTASLNDFSKIYLSDQHVLYSNTGFVFCTFKSGDCGSLDEMFASWLSETTILSDEEYNIACAYGIFKDDEETSGEARPEAQKAVDGETRTTEPAASGTQTAGGFCPQCGAPVIPGDRFCCNCGAPLAAQENPVAGGSAGPSEESLRAFVEQLSQQVGSDPTYVHCAPHIPEEKLQNVLTSYAQNMSLAPEDILVLCDSTIRGSARDGFILTKDYLISSEKGPFALKDIEWLETPESLFHAHMYVHPGKREFLSIPPDKELRAFCEGMNKLLKK
ncbi:MAG: zinc-ribbon domain-containing protein [Acidaminococcus sp.]|nr:zinc-ribbon domain-containing protein [Acidaminococcus sp.]MCI2099742.1 zinc-ribbon domain-containing protein [Acidaminococcus sp.]MCI2113988.1 zinc-ribbon domain-containing protein [Acidaminococcus sp.]MCI2116097.1 zinc-ribbon domain-containing protein [Acidaminococcus sp.]